MDMTTRATDKTKAGEDATNVHESTASSKYSLSGLFQLFWIYLEGGRKRRPSVAKKK